MEKLHPWRKSIWNVFSVSEANIGFCRIKNIFVLLTYQYLGACLPPPKHRKQFVLYSVFKLLPDLLCKFFEGANPLLQHVYRESATYHFMDQG